MISLATKKFPWYRRSSIVIVLICSCIFFLTRCVNEEGNKKNDPVAYISFNDFAGSAVCAGCHKSIYDTHIHTGHYLTSGISSEKNIKGSFAPGKNTFTYDLSRKVCMEKRDSGLYQVMYEEGAEKIAQRFDITIGSGTRGQTFVSWIANSLYQLPVSYFTPSDSWANSPGYLPHKISFNRSVPSRCLECHSTFANKISAPGEDPEKFDRTKIIYGVDCEKCHGPAANHVAFHSQNPKETKAKFIITPASFSRQQSLDLCALCHGGRLKQTKPSFAFMTGDDLSHYFALDTAAPDRTRIDVHGNQYGLLRASKCFRMSATLTCVTCHDTHKNERGQLSVFSQHCISCHNSEHNNVCKMSAELGPGINQNCIDCHMPEKSSQLISVLLPGNTTPTAVRIRSHYISINPGETKKFMEGRKKSLQK